MGYDMNVEVVKENYAVCEEDCVTN